ncbi:MAG: DMT family transporter [Thermaurantiacus sp.]
MRAGPVPVYLAGMALFCGMDAVIKHLVGTNPVVMVTFWRYVVAVVFTLPFWWRAGSPPVRREMLPVHALRGALIAASAFLFFWSLNRLTLAEAVTIAFVAPLMVPPLASAILGERVKLGNVWPALLGFGGVLVAAGGLGVERLTEERITGIIAVLVSALLYAITVVLLRARAARDGPELVSLLGATIPAVILLPFVAFTVPGEAILPGRADAAWFLAAGFLGALALQLMARAYAGAEAQRLAPFEYTAFGWAALFGWLFFAEPLAAATMAGAAIIVAACLWQARREAIPTPTSPAA